MAWLAVTLPLLTGCGSASGGNTGGSAAASCVAPYLNDQPPSGSYRSPTPSVRPGGTLTVYGHWYTATCNDTGGLNPVTALGPVRLTLMLPGGKTQRLGEFSPGGRDMGFAVLVRVPAETPAGAATIRDNRASSSAHYRFIVTA